MRILVGSGCLLMACGPVAPAQPFARALPSYVSGSTFAVVGDTQRTSLLEFFRESNDREREMVMGEIARSRPDFLVFTGDLVFDGASAEKWEYFDRLTEPVHRADIPAVATLGNHEYWSGHSGDALFFARFPLLREDRYYALPFGPLRLIFLDSNIDEYNGTDWQAQLDWFAAKLREADADASVRGVMIFEHHPPYTNSCVTSDEEHVQRDLVPPFLATKKSLAFLSGHVHSYERFQNAGRTFVVSGGGGGPRAALDLSESRRHPDDLYAGPSLRDFHFTQYRVTADGIQATVRGVAKNGEDFKNLDEFLLSWPAQ